jgi:TetR/AcrR family transcriptional regulator, transcriptional repressor for nem operon
MFGITADVKSPHSNCLYYRNDRSNLIRKMVKSTKERILQAAEPLIRAKSFHSVGLQEILSAAEVPKGSFYHLFESKEQFGVELLQHYFTENTERLTRFFRDPETRAMQKFIDLWNFQIGWFTDRECRECCLVMKLGLEVTSFSEPMRDVMAQALASWRRIYADVVRSGQADGSIRLDIDPGRAAAAIQDIWQGAQQRAVVERTAEPLRGASSFLREFLASK